MSSIVETPFGTASDGKSPVSLFSFYSSPTAHDTDHLVAEVTNYGATLLSLYLPCSSRRHKEEQKKEEEEEEEDAASRDVVVGYDTLPPFFSKDNPYFGATIGRVANRIAQGAFDLPEQYVGEGGTDTVHYQLPLNQPPNHSHGGGQGFSHKLWAAEVVHNGSSTDGKGDKSRSDSSRLTLRYTSADGEEGYPGLLHVAAHIDIVPQQNDGEQTTTTTTTTAHALRITYEAALAPEERKSTIANIANHCYFHLGGQRLLPPASPPSTDESAVTDATTIYDHRIALRASRFVVTDVHSIPTGELRPGREEPPMDLGRDFFDKSVVSTASGSGSSSSSASPPSLLSFSPTWSLGRAVPLLVHNYREQHPAPSSSSSSSLFGVRFGDGIDAPESASPQIVVGHGYDHSYAIDDYDDNGNSSSRSTPQLAAVAVLPSSSSSTLTKTSTADRYLAVYTTQPGVQLYTGNGFSGGDGDDDADDGGSISTPSKSGQPRLASAKRTKIPRRGAFALEAQHFPDSVNHSNFPSVVLRPGQQLRETTIFELGYM